MVSISRKMPGLILILFGLFCASPEEATVVREPCVAGQFYPGDAKTLQAMVDRMLADAEPPAPTGRLVAIQVPHAGYPYSGPTAAYAFKLLAGMDSVTVVMLGPSHRVPVHRAAVFAKGKWRTPLGDVTVDEELAKAVLAQDSFFTDAPELHKDEHSLEVEVPFLQRVLEDFRILPIMLLQPSWKQCELVGKALARACKGRKVVLLASTDLCHGYSYEDGQKADSLTCGLMIGLDPKQMHESLDKGKAQACGGYAVVAVMVAARELGADNAVLLRQTNSNDVTGERSGYCVGYSAVAFFASQAQEESAGDSDELTEEEQQSLLGIARSTLEQYIRTGKAPEVKPLTPRLAENRGAFVTLNKHGELRGCIGYIEAFKPLYLTVRDNAVNASTQDPRFMPVTPEELGDIDIEITVLSPTRPISDPDSVVVGRHGLIARRGGRSGLLLPQVPVEQGWNRESFLNHTCLKAGLAPDAWKDPKTQLLVFTGQVFGEEH